METNNKSSKKYHLAHTITTFPTSQSYQLHQKPLIIHQNTVNPPQKSNIFRNLSNNSLMVNKNSFSNDQRKVSYDIVGQKQMKAYETKIQKKKLHANYSFKKTESLLSLSRISHLHIKAPQDIYFNKDEIIKMCQSNKNNKNRTLPHEEQLYIMPTAFQSKNNFNATISAENTIYCINTMQATARVDHSQQNSRIKCQINISKIKNKLDKYEGIWQRQIANTNQQAKFMHQKSKKIHLQRSILQNINKFRQTLEVKEHHTLEEKEKNIHPDLWSTNLRSPCQLKEIYQAIHIPKIQKNSLKIGGRSKLKNQLNWIDRKEKQGFCFSLGKKQNQNDP